MIPTSISTEPFLMVGDVYEKMKTKCENKTRYTTYFALLYNTLLEMFTYTNLPPTIPKRFLESILHSTGEVFVAVINGELVATTGTLSGEVDAYGLGKECIAVCPTGEARGERGVDIAYGVNNDTATPDMLIYWITHLLGETDKSLALNIIYSRLLNIPKVSNDKDKAMFEDILKKVIDGEPAVFASKNALDLELGAGTECFQLTDPNKIEKLPYLTQAFEDAIKRFYNFYGQPMQNQNKRAQSISDEIHGQDSVSFIIPSQMLACRKALVDQINTIFGTDISVEFSPLWKLEWEALVLRDTNGNGAPDVSEQNVDNANNLVDNADSVDSVDTEQSEPSEPAELEEPEEPEEPTEPTTPTEPEEPTDIPAMELEPMEETPEDTTEGNYNIEEIADALDVTPEELKQLIDERAD